MRSIVVFFTIITLCCSYTIYDGMTFTDSWALLNTAGNAIELHKNDTTQYIKAELRCWDTIRVQRTDALDTTQYNFFSYVIEYRSDRVHNMKFRSRLFSSFYNQQTETELKPYDYTFREGQTIQIFVPLTITNEKNTLQTFTIQRIEPTDCPIEFRILNITLEKEGVPTLYTDIVEGNDESKNDESCDESNGSSLSIISLIGFISFILFLLL